MVRGEVLVESSKMLQTYRSFHSLISDTIIDLSPTSL